MSDIRMFQCWSLKKCIMAVQQSWNASRDWTGWWMPLGNCNHYVAKALFLIWPLGGALKPLKNVTQPVLFKVLFLQDTSEHFFPHSNCPVLIYSVCQYFIYGSLITVAPITLKSCWHIKYRMFILCMRLFHVATCCVVWQQLKYTSDDTW